MRSQIIDAIALVLLATFGVAFSDVFVLAPLGVRLLPAEYEIGEALVLVSAALAFVAGITTVRRRRSSERSVLSMKVPGYVIVLLGLAPIALASVLGFLGAFHWFLDLFSYLRLQYTAVLALGVVVLMALGRKNWARIGGLFLLANLAVVFPYVIGWPRASASTAGPEIRLVLANVNAGNTNHEKVKSSLSETSADVILIAELTETWAEALSELDLVYPYSLTVPQGGGFGIGLWSRLPLVSPEVVAFAHAKVPSLVVKIEMDGKVLTIVGTHPLPPRDAGNSRLRNQQLERAAAAALEGGPYAVVLGDLNATPWSAAFRSMVAGGRLRDSALGRGLEWSWPAGFWPLALPIDHCLVSERVQVVDRWMGPDVGSDHYPLVVDVRLAD